MRKYLLHILIISFIFFLTPTIQAASDVEEKIEPYKKAIRIKPGFAMAHYNLGLVYGKSGMYKEAIEVYKQVIRIKPSFAVAHYNLGVACLKSGRYKEAILALKHAIRIGPNYVDAHYNLGAAYVCLNDRDSAVEQYNILKNLDFGVANKLFKLINK